MVRTGKRAMRMASLGEYVKDGATLALAAPFVASAYLDADQLRRPAPAMQDLAGVAVTPFTAHDDRLPELVVDLGVKHLLLRVPVWDLDRLADYRRFIDRFPGCDWLVAVVQNRDSVCRPGQWMADLRRIFAAFRDRVSDFQLPLAPNRTKWGCIHMGEALDLLEQAESIRREFPGLRLVGPGIIDFEPATWIRALINRRRFTLDVAGALLYVDRRGGPHNPQYGVFDFANKLRLWKAVMATSPRCRRHGHTPLWITEVNWPLENSGEYGPTSAEEEVSETDAADYLVDYFRIAAASGLVERVYWWQLVQRGYGLVDDRTGDLRKRPTYERLKKLIGGALPTSA
jgi:hypothetical protein